MNILLTNDDGIRAPGILAMHEALTRGTTAHAGPLGGAATRVLTVAPLTVQSATSHGITFHEPVMTREEVLPHERDLPGERANPTGVAVDGRPADCVKIAVSSVWPERFGKNTRPDLLISGINAGANCGINVIYSGTVAAAIEGAFLGIPSVAISLRMGRGRPRFDLAAARARHVLEKVLAAKALRPYEILSINIPTTEEAPVGVGVQSPELAGVARHDPNAKDPATMPPIRVCPMNVHGLIDKYERRVSPMGDVYYWAAGHGLDFHATELGSDVDLLLQGCITVTPLKFDLTQHATVEAWRERLEG
ncbi:MAG TPA: 5'/3'-nucleotidase SurE [Phycisphaerales bacterium]|nr:5'/3'-nucleotidase SurE [Phycisphaerales bacterium]